MALAQWTSGWKLVGGLPVIGDGVAVVITGFIVQDLMFYSMAFLCKAVHDSSVCSNMVLIMAELKGFN